MAKKSKAKSTQSAENKGTMTRTQLCDFLRIGRNTYYKLKKTDPDFPKSFTPGRTTLYFFQDVIEYARLLQKREAQQAADARKQVAGK